MRRTERISPWQFVLLMVWVVEGTGLFTIPRMINHYVPFHDGWIAGALVIIGCLGVVAIYLAYVRVFPECDIETACKLAFGKWFGNICLFWIALWLYLASCSITREWSIYLENNYFPTTPIYILTLIIISVVSYAAYGGLEVIARMAEIISPFAFFILAILMFLPLNHAHLEYLFPVLSAGLGPVFHAGVPVASIATDLLVCLFMVTTLSDSSRGGRYLLYSSIIVTLMVVLTQGLTIVVLGATGTSMLFPFLETIRSIVYGQFLQRLDSFYVIVNLGTLFLKLSVFEYALIRSLKAFIGSSRHNELTWGIGALIWSGSIFLFRNTASLSHFLLDTLPAFDLSVVCLILFVIACGQMMRSKHT